MTCFPSSLRHFTGTVAATGAELTNVTEERGLLNDTRGYEVIDEDANTPKPSRGTPTLPDRLVLLTLIAIALTSAVSVAVCCTVWRQVHPRASQNNDTSVAMTPLECLGPVNDSPPPIPPPDTPASLSPPAYSPPVATLRFTGGDKGWRSYHHGGKRCTFLVNDKPIFQMSGLHQLLPNQVQLTLMSWSRFVFSLKSSIRNATLLQSRNRRVASAGCTFLLGPHLIHTVFPTALKWLLKYTVSTARNITNGGGIEEEIHAR